MKIPLQEKYRLRMKAYRRFTAENRQHDLSIRLLLWLDDTAAYLHIPLEVI